MMHLEYVPKAEMVAIHPKSSELSQAKESLELAYQQYRQELRRFFELNARDRQIVDDLMQMMYLQMLKAQSPDAIREPQNYLFQTAWNVLHTQNRRAAQDREQALHFDSKALDMLADRSNSLWVEDDTTTAIVQADAQHILDQLPRACRVALLRQYRDKRTYQEIADELGVTVHGVKKNIARALAQFTAYFDSSGQTK